MSWILVKFLFTIIITGNNNDWKQGIDNNENQINQTASKDFPSSCWFTFNGAFHALYKSFRHLITWKFASSVDDYRILYIFPLLLLASRSNYYQILKTSMAKNTTVFNTFPNNILLFSIVFKFIALIIRVLGNVTVIIYIIFSKKEKTATSYLIGSLALADLLKFLTFYPIWIFELIQTILNIDNDQDFFASSTVLQCGHLCSLQPLHFLQLRSIVINLL